jgi:hypothetical protein
LVEALPAANAAVPCAAAVVASPVLPDSVLLPCTRPLVPPAVPPCGDLDLSPCRAVLWVCPEWVWVRVWANSGGVGPAGESIRECLNLAGDLLK